MYGTRLQFENTLNEIRTNFIEPNAETWTLRVFFADKIGTLGGMQDIMESIEKLIKSGIMTKRK